MAIIDKNGNKRGKEGNTIYRVLGGVQISQALPKAPRQTTETKKSSVEFGLCSNTAKSLRNIFIDVFGWADRQMGARLVGVVKNAIFASSSAKVNQRDLHDGDWTYFKNFQINRHSPLNQLLKPRPLCSVSEDGVITVFVPQIDLKRDLYAPSPSRAANCDFRITLLSLNLRSGYYELLDRKELNSQELSSEAHVWTFDQTVEDGSAVLVFASLHYYLQDEIHDRRELNGESLNPAEIIGAYQFWRGRQGTIDSPEALIRLSVPGYTGNELLANVNT